MVGEKRWLDIELVATMAGQASMLVAENAAEAFGDRVRQFFDDPSTPQFESPLEAAFAIWWMAVADPVIPIELKSQHKVRASGMDYRLDFVIVPTADVSAQAEVLGLKWAPMCVEVDGHAFHEKTLEQVTYRNQRDRALQQAGWTVFHVSYSELVTDGCSATIEIYDKAMESVWPLVAAIQDAKGE